MSDRTFEQKGIVGGKECSLFTKVTECNSQKLYDQAIVISFYRGSFPFRVEMKSNDGEGCRKFIEQAFSRLVKEVTERFQGKAGIDLDSLLVFITSFRDQKVLEAF
jgi:hypothetical protein